MTYKANNWLRTPLVLTTNILNVKESLMGVHPHFVSLAYPGMGVYPIYVGKKTYFIWHTLIRLQLLSIENTWECLNLSFWNECVHYL